MNWSWREVPVPAAPSLAVTRMRFGDAELLGDTEVSLPEAGTPEAVAPGVPVRVGGGDAERGRVEALTSRLKPLVGESRTMEEMEGTAPEGLVKTPESVARSTWASKPG